MNNETHPKMKYVYVGIDSHKLTHTATIINCFNETLGVLTFNNSDEGFNELLDLVNKVSKIPAIYGLEDTKQYGYMLGKFLLDKKCIVKHINSTETAAERRKYPIAIKNDELDSACIAKVTLDNWDKLANIENDEIYWTLKQLVKMRETIVKSNIGTKNKFHSQLLFNYPNYSDLFKDISCKSALRFWEAYPSPDLLKDVTDEEFFQFFKQHGNCIYNSRINKIIENVRKLNTDASLYQGHRNVIITMLVRQIKDNNARLENIEAEIINIYDLIGKKLHTFPCIDKVSAAHIIAEIGDINRFANSSKLAKYAGIAPIEFSSGGKEKSYVNKFGNRKLNTLIYSASYRGLSTGTCKRPLNPIFKEYFIKKTSSGKTKNQAMLCIMRRIINIIYNILKNDVEYIPPKHLVDECLVAYEKRQQEELEKNNKSKQPVI